MFCDIQIDVSDKVYTFCAKFAIENNYDRSYADDELHEYYPNVNLFQGNFDFESISIGVLPFGNLREHIDDSRDSALIIPINKKEITLLVDSQIIPFKSSFLLDTTILHGAENNMPNTIFLAIDFKKKFKDSIRYLSAFDNLTLTI